MAGFAGVEYTVTGTATSLTSALNLPASHYSDVAFKAPLSNADSVYLGGAGVTTGANRYVILEPGYAFSLSLSTARISSGQIFIIGTPGDKLHIAAFS